MPLSANQESHLSGSDHLTAPRIYFLDYIRVMACFMVMVVHSSENFYLCPSADSPAGEMVDVVSKITSYDARLWVSLLDGFCRMSVPLFMLTSSYLLCPMPENESWMSFFRRRAIRILPPMVLFLVLYSLLPLLWGGTSLSQALSDLFYIPLNFPGAAGHMWFLYPLISIYLFIPILSPWLRQASREQELFVIILFVLSTTLPFFNRYGLDVFGQVWWNPYHMLYPFAGYIGYLVLGHFIRFHIHWSASRRFAIAIPCIIIGAVVTILSFYMQIEIGTEQQPTDVEIGWCFCTPNVILLAFGMFLLFSTIDRPMSGYRVIKDISRFSYGMYLMHMFFLVMYSSVFVPLLHVSLAIPSIAACTFVSCYILTKILSYMPGSRYIIG